MSAGVEPAASSGFYSEEVDPDVHVDVRSVDVTWAQVRPDADAGIDGTATGSAQGVEFAPLDVQLAQDGEFWMRLFASGRDWAPTWVVADCGVATYDPDDDGQRHRPIWGEYVWAHLLDTYREVFAADRGNLVADDLLAAQAGDAGLGIRTGIGEVSNFHLSQAPAHGSGVQPDGHLLVDETLPVHDGTRVVAGENECFTDCGYDTDDPYYAVRQANLKALQPGGRRPDADGRCQRVTGVT